MVERMGRMLQGDLRRALCRLASNKIHLEQDRLNRKNDKIYHNPRVMGFLSRCFFCLWQFVG